MDPETTEVAATETKAEAPQSLDERMLKSVEKMYGEAVAAENSTEQTETTEAEAAETTEKPAVETKADEQKEEVTELPWTAEQMRDPKFYDRLDKKGWETLEQYSPAMAEKARAVYSALGKATSPKYREQQSQTETRTDTPTQKSLNPELKAAITKANSFDDTEAAEGLQQIIKLTLAEALPEALANTPENKAMNVAREAYATVVAAKPEIANLNLAELDALVDGDETLSNLIAVADGLPDDKRVAITANVMRQAGERLLAKKQTENAAANETKRIADEKKRKTNAKVQSNATLTTNAVIEASASGTTATGKKSMEQFVHDKFAEAAGNG